VPLANRASIDVARASSPQLDLISTGSTPRGNEYTVRKSVLQSSASSVCVIRSDGQSVGDC
jgi:hypothetical protein